MRWLRTVGSMTWHRSRWPARSAGFFEQYSHEPRVATPRFILKHLPADSPRRSELPQRLKQGLAALGVMEAPLEGRQYFVGDRYSIADITERAG